MLSDSTPVLLKSKFLLNGIRFFEIEISEVSDNSERYAAWPQGKVYTKDQEIHLIYNAGSSLSGPDLAVYLRTSSDFGRTWTSRETVYEETGWSKGVTAWAAGSDRAGNETVIVRRRGDTFGRFSAHGCPRGTDHILLTRDEGRSRWSKSDIDWSRSHQAPVLYHAYLPRLDRGFESFWHMPDHSAIGVARFVGDDVEHDVFALDPRKLGLCEATAVRIEDRLFGFFRVQSTVSGPQFWTSDASYGEMKIYEVEGVVSALSPVPLVELTDRTLFAASCDRHGSAVLRVHHAADPFGAPQDWSTTEIASIPSRARGSSGTGAPALIARDGEFLIVFGSQGPTSSGSSLYSITGKYERA